MTKEATTHKGRTEDADAPFLGGEFWKPGVKIVGEVDEVKEARPGSGFGESYVLALAEPVTVAGEQFDRVQIGQSLTGFRLAMQAADLKTLRVGWTLHVECTGIKKSKAVGFNDRINFELTVVEASRSGDISF